jgi:hypothetical protein
MTAQSGLLVYRAEPLTSAVRSRLGHAALQHGKAVVLAPVYDTIKRVEGGCAAETLDRDALRQPVAWACTPENEPPSDPPPAEWFVGAAAIESPG